LNHVSIFVLNQQSAYEFYVNKLGFKVHIREEVVPGMQWITTCPPEQPQLEISLMAVKSGMMFNQESGRLMRALVENGTFAFRRF